MDYNELATTEERQAFNLGYDSVALNLSIPLALLKPEYHAAFQAGIDKAWADGLCCDGELVQG